MKDILLRIPGGDSYKEIIDICSRFDGYSLGGFVRSCIDYEIRRRHDIDVSEVDHRKQRYKTPITGNVKGAIIRIVNQCREFGQKILDSSTLE